MTFPTPSPSTRDRLSVVGVSHHTAALAERERFAFPERVGDAILAAQGREALLLTTCNRTELYALDEPAALERRLLDAAPGGDPRILFAHHGEAAVRHLFSVAAGLDSMIVGEPQILGQVKRAMRAARESGSLGPVMDELTRRAIVVGRRARRETALGSGLPSIPKVATAMARLVLGDLAGATLLLVGTGKLGGLTGRTLHRVGAGALVVTNRTPGPATELAERIGGRAEPFERLDDLLAAADVVVTCTAAEEPILSRARVAAALERRRGRRPLVLIDIAVPRDVAADVRSLDGVRLHDLDDLRGWGSAAVGPDAIEDARAIVNGEAARFLAWLSAREAAPTIRALHERADAILERAIAESPGEDAEALRRFGRRLLARLLHQPVTRLREGTAEEGEAYLRVARALFALDGRPTGRQAREWAANGHSGDAAAPAADGERAP